MGERLPPGIALIRGTGMHRGIQANLEAKIQTGENAPAEEVEALTRDAVKHEAEQEVLYTRDEAARGAPAVVADASDQAAAMALAHRAELAPAVKPVAVERQWRIEMRGFPRDLAGTIDCDEGVIVDDWKSASKAPRKTEADLSTQMTVYAMAKAICDGGAIPMVRMGYMVLGAKGVRTQFLESRREQEDFLPLLRAVERVCEAVDKEVYPFAACMDPRPWWCDPRWCGYFKTCPAVSGRVQVVMQEGNGDE